MTNLNLLFLVIFSLLTSTSYAETDLVDVFYKTYKEHDKKRDRAMDHYISLVELGNLPEDKLISYGKKHDQSKRKVVLPVWFREATLAYQRFGGSEEVYKEAINKLLSNEYLRTLDAEDGSMVVSIQFDAKAICNIISWSVGQCIKDIEAVQNKVNTNVQGKIQQIAEARKAKADEKALDKTNKLQALDKLITGTMGYELGGKTTISIKTCKPFKQEFLAGYKEANKSKQLYSTRNTIGFGPDQIRNLEIQFELANSSDYVVPATCIVKAKQSSNIFNGIAVEIGEESKVISSIYAYKAYDVVPRKQFPASYSQCEADLNGLKQALQNKYGKFDSNTLNGENRSISAFCAGGDVNPKVGYNKYQARLVLIYTDNTLRKSTYKQIYALHKAKHKSNTNKYAGEI